MIFKERGLHALSLFRNLGGNKMTTNGVSKKDFDHFEKTIKAGFDDINRSMNKLVRLIEAYYENQLRMMRMTNVKEAEDNDK
jgi:hypothetical protein